jgi:hypothetical protein
MSKLLLLGVLIFIAYNLFSIKSTLQRNIEADKKPKIRREDRRDKQDYTDFEEVD